jgi:hypothetical protein
MAACRDRWSSATALDERLAQLHLRLHGGEDAWRRERSRRGFVIEVNCDSAPILALGIPLLA